MGLAITDFKSNMAAAGGSARPSLYEVDINGKTSTMSFTTNQNILCKDWRDNPCFQLFFAYCLPSLNC